MEAPPPYPSPSDIKNDNSRWAEDPGNQMGNVFGTNNLKLEKNFLKKKSDKIQES